MVKSSHYKYERGDYRLGSTGAAKPSGFGGWKSGDPESCSDHQIDFSRKYSAVVNQTASCQLHSSSSDESREDEV